MIKQEQENSDRRFPRGNQIQLNMSSGFKSYTQLKKNKIKILKQHKKLQAPYKQSGWTNAVLVYLHKNQIMMMQNNSVDVYLPGYLRFKIKNFLKISLQDNQSTINALIVFSVYYGSLPQEFVQAFKKKIVLQFNRDDPIKLTDESDNSFIQIDQDEDLKLITYKIRIKLNIAFTSGRQFKICWGKVDTSIWFSPFELIYQRLLITINKTRISKKDMIGQNDSQKEEKWNKIKVFFGLQKLKSIKMLINLMDFVIEDKYQKMFQNDEYSTDKLFTLQAYKQLTSIVKRKLEYSKQPMLGNYAVAYKKLQTKYSQRKYQKIKQIYKYQSSSQQRLYEFENKGLKFNKNSLTQFNKQVCLYLLKRYANQQSCKAIQRQSIGELGLNGLVNLNYCRQSDQRDRVHFEISLPIWTFYRSIIQNSLCKHCNYFYSTFFLGFSQFNHFSTRLRPFKSSGQHCYFINQLCRIFSCYKGVDSSVQQSFDGINIGVCSSNSQFLLFTSKYLSHRCKQQFFLVGNLVYYICISQYYNFADDSSDAAFILVSMATNLYFRSLINLQ